MINPFVNGLRLVTIIVKSSTVWPKVLNGPQRAYQGDFDSNIVRDARQAIQLVDVTFITI